jgi:hypothetical protein
MTYTVRFAHMDKAPAWKEGDHLTEGDTVGIMGTSGQSTAIHLHIDCVAGKQTEHFLLSDMANGKQMPNKRQLDYFIDAGLFGVLPVITTAYADPDYTKQFGKIHYAYDVVPVDRKKTKDHYEIKWNRSKTGLVTLVEYDPHGYGHCIYIAFDA